MGGRAAKPAAAGAWPAVQRQRLQTGNRQSAEAGFVFSIDATLAVFLMILMLEATVFLSMQADEDPYGGLMASRAGNDALFAMAQSNALSSANNSTIEAAMDSMLPENIGASLEISTYYYDRGNFTHANTTAYGESQPANTTVYSARRDFVASKNGMAATYSIARMLVWQK